MNIFDLLKGKKVKVMTDAKVEVELEIEKVIEETHSEDLEESTAANDWYPKTRDYHTYRAYFTNGFDKVYSSLSEINVLS
jgi:hypothetical protein